MRKRTLIGCVTVAMAFPVLMGQSCEEKAQNVQNQTSQWQPLATAADPFTFGIPSLVLGLTNAVCVVIIAAQKKKNSQATDLLTHANDVIPAGLYSTVTDPAMKVVAEKIVGK